MIFRVNLLLFFLLPFVLKGQMPVGNDTLYGNEWIDFSKTYYRVRVKSDGVYRLTGSDLAALAGVPGSSFRLYRMGRQEPLYVSADGPLAAGDVVEFFGQGVQSELDSFLFDHAAAEQVNPWVGMFTDSSAYYLVEEPQSPALRYTVVPNDLSNLPPAEPFAFALESRLFATAHFKRRKSSKITYSWFDGNGFARPQASVSQEQVLLPGLYLQGPSVEATVRYAADLSSHRVEMRFNDSLAYEDDFVQFGIREHTIALASAFVQQGLMVTVSSVADVNDQHALAAVRVRYPKSLSAFQAPYAVFEMNGSGSPQYLELSGFQSNQSDPVVYDLTNRLRLKAVVEGGKVKVLMPAAVGQRTVAVVAAEALLKPGGPVPLRFRDFRQAPGDYLMVYNPRVNVDKTTGTDYVSEYADYRRSAAGGSHEVLTVDVRELYEQFAYGQFNHPLALRNFFFFRDKQGQKPRFALLVGKALDYPSYRDPELQGLLADSLYNLPTYSTPGADVPFALRGNRLSEPLLAIGRLAVTGPLEIRDYLEKLRVHEQQLSLAPQTLAGKAWMKRVLHNSGGFADESDLIRGYTANLTQEIEQNRFGGEVTTLYKTSNDPIQQSAYERILEEVNGGTALWTIFGHSSPTVVDFDIGQVEGYQNKGRYPVMLIMGCFSGICSTPQKGLGEKFLLARDKGAIAYIASVNYGFIDALHTYGQTFYGRLGGEDYGKSIGEAYQKTVGDLAGTSSSALIAVLHQNLLQGDPAVHVHTQPGPDYLVDPASVRFDPNPIGLEQQAYTLRFDVVNLGENTGGVLPIRLDQRLPDQTVLQRLQDTIPAPPLRKTLEYTLPILGSKIGFNRFFLSVDPGNAVPELPPAAEMNNDLEDGAGQKGIDVYVYSNDVLPVYPENYGIVGKTTCTVRASTLNVNAAPQRYLFEMDTSYAFDSPFKKSHQVVERGGLLQWALPGVLQDSHVYYWRVARDSLVNGQVVWRTRSFTCLPGVLGGWNQGDYGQYRDGKFSNLKAADAEKRLEFLDNAVYLSHTVAFRDVGRYPGFNNAFDEGFKGDYGWNIRAVDDGVVVVVLDPNTGQFVRNPPGGPFNHLPTEEIIYYFHTRDSLERLKLMDFLDNGIPSKYYVGLLAFGRPWDSISYAPQRWAADSLTAGRNLFQMLEQQGARDVRRTVPFTTAPPAYGIIYRKDFPAYPAIDTLVFNADSAIDLRGNFLAKWTVGALETPVIGPAASWKSLHWRVGAFDNGSDTVQLSLLGVRPGLPDTVLLGPPLAKDLLLDSQLVAGFDFLKLRYESRDTLKRTVVQPHYLRVLYEGLPEGALHPAAGLVFYRDTLQEGETVRFRMPFVNISDWPMDSVLVQYRLETAAGNQSISSRVKPLPPGDTLWAALERPTFGLAGPNKLVLSVNPNDDQPELYHGNNASVFDFFVVRDNRNPLLDVTFDGTRLADGDLVSPQPVVVATLRDDSPFLALSDTTAFSLMLTLPDGSVQPLAFSDPAVQFFPADSTRLPQKNQARLEWRPVFTQDGDYRLTVNGRDATGNKSGVLDYTVRFRVVTKSSLSNVLNYPNPFSTSTCFVYTMTGAETPAQFKVQIMTVSGRVVREVLGVEFGDLRAGTHRSDFCWDGRDQYGDQLANGVYLYRVVAKKADGSNFEFFDNQGIDGYFKNGFGKMVLIR